MTEQTSKRGYTVVERVQWKPFVQQCRHFTQECTCEEPKGAGGYFDHGKRRCTQMSKESRKFCPGFEGVPVELNADKKPACFGRYGYRVCVNKTTPPSTCPWEQRCYNSQEDT